MSYEESIILPYLFGVLFGFILVNLAVGLCLHSLVKNKNLRLLSFYWGSLLFTYALQGIFQTGDLPIILSYSTNIIPVVIMSIILYDSLLKSPPVRLFFSLWALGLGLSCGFYWTGQSFTMASLPLSLALGATPLIAASELLLKNNENKTYLQKFIGLLLVAAAIHFVNFSLFRRDPGAQLWGWGVAFALYQVFSMLLLALIIENQALKENQRLNEQVELRTQELKKTLSVKETLFRMVLHDIATPIQGQLLVLSALEKNSLNQEMRPTLIKRLLELTGLVKRVIEQVRSMEAVTSGKHLFQISPVSFERCLEDIKVVFDRQLSEKGISLNIQNELSPEARFRADQTVFTTSVLGNLVSNAIKFSSQGSTLTLRAFERSERILIEVKDEGIGIPEDVVSSIFDLQHQPSRDGTEGEKGTGFGMAQVKSFVEYFGGQVDVQSWPEDRFPSNHGTKVTLSMDRALGHLQ